MSILTNKPKCHNIGDLTVYYNIFEYMDSNMYLFVEKNKALVVDPHYDKKIDNFLKENNISDVTVLLTHEHTDHITGLKYFKDNFNTKAISTAYCSKYISDERLNRPILARFILDEKDRTLGTNYLEKFNNEYKPFICPADITFEDEFEFDFNLHKIKFKKITGHSKGSCCIFLDDKVIFTGDSLLKKYPVITRFPGGSKKEYLNFAVPFFENLNKNLFVLPGHGESFVLGELIKDNKLQITFK